MPELFGMRISSPREMFDGAVRTAQSAGSEAARLGSVAVSRASELGRTIDTTVRDVGASVDRGIAETQTWAQTGIRDGVTWTGRQVKDGADAARAAVGDDTMLGQVATTVITSVEQRTRFNVGVVGGVANEAVGLVGTAATLGSTVTQMQLSPTRRAEVGQAVAGALASGVETTFQYGQSVAANPGRLSGDVEAVWQGGVDLGERVVNHYETAIAEGRGPEAFGMTTGQVLANVIPIGASANVARAGATGALRLTAREGAEALAREGTETVAREGGEVVARTDSPLRNIPLSETMETPSDYGVAFFGETNLRYYLPENATLGREGSSFFMMPLDDSSVVVDAASAARFTGMSPSTLEAYRSGGEIYGLSFPTRGMEMRVPLEVDANGWPHFLEGGHTAVRTGDGPNSGFLVNPTRELVIPGGTQVPKGSVLFRLGDGGAWEPLRRY